jgi:DNA mismatch repair protein MutS
MTQNLTSLYQKVYEEYRNKYGENVCVLLLVGKFYEIYCLLDPETETPRNSARRAMEIMNIAIKIRPNYGPKGETGLWGGVPEQSLHKFARPLTDAGWTVVVVDQVRDEKTDEVIDRATARILSPGTHVETAGQDRLTVAALWIEPTSTSASIVDLTTGEVFSYTSPQTDDILHMLQVYGSKEVIVTSRMPYDIASLKSSYGIHGTLHPVAFVKGDNFEHSYAREEFFRKLFRLRSLMPVRTTLGLDGAPPCLERALCLLLRFLEDHFPQQTERLCSHELYSPKKHMRLSNNILEQLNIITFNSQRSVLSLLERTHSAIGKRALRERILRPITDTSALEERWSQVAWATTLDAKQQRALERDIKALYDLPRLHHKFAEGSIQALDVLQLAQTYAATTCLIQNLKGTPLECSPTLELLICEFRHEFSSAFDEEKAQRREGGQPIGFLTPISGAQTEQIEVNLQKIQETWEAAWGTFCRDAKIPVDSFKLESKGIGEGEYVWEGARSTLKALQAEVFLQNKKESPALHSISIDHKKSGPIQLNCQEFTTFTHSLRAQVKLLERSLKQEVQVACDSLWESVKQFQQVWVEWLGTVDCTLALASVANSCGWCRPQLGDALTIEGLRHPLLEAAQTRAEYIKHRVELGGAHPQGWLIYGVNASGKSSLMKATGIAVLLAQAGSFVPADSMILRPYDAAFSRIWSHDNLWAGLSSFAVEVAELRDILNLATERSLVLGDEVCSGTESQSATALVASVLEHLDAQGCHFMFATHLHGLLDVPRFLPRPGIAVWHLRVQRTVEGKLIYDRTLQPGAGSSTYGLEVARAMGLPISLLERAHEIRRSLGGEMTAADAPKSSWNPAIARQSCEVCKRVIVKDLEVHHITPRCEGGGNQLRNLVVLCEECHDKHHAGELEIGELRVTSEGLERSTTVSAAKQPTQRRKQWSEEDQQIIRTTLEKFNGRPLTRACLALEEQGIHITAAQLKKFQQQPP